MSAAVFVKYRVWNQSYLVYDCLKYTAKLSDAQIRSLCHAVTGFGANGIIIGPEFHYETPCMHMYDANGCEMNSNSAAVAVFSRYLQDSGYLDASVFSIETATGPVTVHTCSQEPYVIRLTVHSFVAGTRPYDDGKVNTVTTIGTMVADKDYLSQTTEESQPCITFIA